MKCPSKKDLYLFYYRDIDEEKMFSIEKHMKNCIVCNKEYVKITGFLSGFEKEGIRIKEAELFSIVNRVKSQVLGRIGLKKRLEEKVKYFIEGFKWSFIYRPRYVVASIIIFIIAVGMPIRNKIVFQEAMMDMQLDLVLDLDSFEEDILLDLYNS